MRSWIAAILALAAGTGASAQEPIPIDGFEEPIAWTAHPADGVELAIRSDEGFSGRSMRLDFRFLKGGGYAIARRNVDLELPENYAFTFRIRGEAPSEHLEFKLIDATNENVWWSVLRDYAFPFEWTRVTIKRRKIQFAWGPSGGGEIRHVAAIELAITAGKGGEGSVWIDELALEPLPPPGAEPPPPQASASSEESGSNAARALDGDPATAWRWDAGDPAPKLLLDLGGMREFGGITILWPGPGAAPPYRVLASEDREAWVELRRVEAPVGGRDHLYLPESEARFLQLEITLSPKIAQAGLAEVILQPLEWAESKEAFFRAIAAERRRGLFPRGITGEQSFWTVVGVDGDRREVLMNEDGMLETGIQSFSIEPFLLLPGGRLVTWADAERRLSLDDEAPIPTASWILPGIELSVTAFGHGEAGASSIIARYRVRNTGLADAGLGLALAFRPFQVNPPVQFLNLVGGTAPIREIVLEGSAARVNGRQAVISLVPASAFGACPFDSGDIVADWLAEGRMPETSRAEDAFQSASGAWVYDLSIPAGGSREIDLWIPLYDGLAAPAWRIQGVAREQAAMKARWRETTGKVRLDVAAGREIVATLRAQIAYIMVNRAGAAIQPGTRAYARSWIRDGSLTCSALLRLGHADAVREFIEWFAPYQYANGKVPCCVDARGSDPVPEHDSSGELIFLIAEHHRYVRDRAFSERMWPHVEAAVAYLDSLRATRRTAEYDTPEKREFFGLLPPSISHEGYSAKPMHSYWDDFFALKGFRDAAYLAESLERESDARRIRDIAEEFQSDLLASIAATMRRHGIDYIPGCADLGDFDAPSTTIALAPVGADGLLPGEALTRTFERYYDFFRQRKGGAAWESYAPYEMRVIGAFVRLGWGERAHELIDYFLAHRRPQEWRQWPEIVWSDLRAPRFQGDLPHTWVGSDYVRSILDLFLHEESRTASLVLMGGIPAEWIFAAPEGIVVADMPTPYGKLGYTAGPGEDGSIVVRIEGGIFQPTGGIRVCPPFPWKGEGSRVGDSPANLDPEGRIIVLRLPAEIIIPRP